MSTLERETSAAIRVAAVPAARPLAPSPRAYNETPLNAGGHTSRHPNLLIMVAASNLLVVVFMAYFLTMNLTVERAYCHAPLQRGDARALIEATIDFCEAANPLFLARPRWMRAATCVHAYGFMPFYALTAVVALLDAWAPCRLLLALFLGAKLNAVAFYHGMQFSSDTPPPNVPLYAAAVLISIYLYI